MTYTLNIAAMVKLTLKRHAAGRNVKGRCVTPTKKNRKRARCTRLVTVPASITLPGERQGGTRLRSPVRSAAADLSAAPIS